MTTTDDTFELAGHRWRASPIGVEAQIEVEVMLARMFGAGAAGALAAVVEGLAPPLVEMLEEWTGEDGTFDLAAILDNVDTSDPRLQTAWRDVIKVLGQVAGDAVRDGVPQISDRLDHQDVLRLFRLIVLSKKCMVQLDGNWKDVTSYELLSRLLRGDPQAKWALLTRCLLATYSPPVIEAEPAEDAGDA